MLRADSALHLVVELARQDDVDDPYAMPDRPQRYQRRLADGGYQTSTLRWTPKLNRLLDAVRTGAEAEARQAVGRTLRAFLDGFGWATAEARIEAALAEERLVVLTLRSAAAELWRLPWALTTFGAGELHLGAQPGVLIRLAWPETHTRPAAERPLAPERVLVAWAAPKRPVPSGPHVTAIAQAAEAGSVPFDPDRDVLPQATPGQLVARLEAARPERPIAALHLLCHGGAAGDAFGLTFAGDDGDAVVVDAGRLANLLGPYADRVRLVVIAACDGGNDGAWAGQLGSVAQMLHRAGFAAVIASARPLSGPGSVAFAEQFYRALLVTPASVERAFVQARQALLSHGGEAVDWAGLQLWARADQGLDTRPITFRPYRGLLPFEAEHARFYFGREAQRAEALSDLETLVAAGRPRFLVVAAASGTGKSSLVRAAVLPDLIAEVPHRRVAIIKPGVTPMAALMNTLGRWGRQPETGPRLLLVDQFEEIFTLSSPEDATTFCQALWALAQDPDDPVLVIVTLRVDFVGRCGHIALEDGLNLDAVCYDEHHRIFVPRMAPADLRQAIEGPAALLGLCLESGLADRILDDVGADPGSLPLLQYALDQLWQRREGRLLTHAAYEAIGGINGALTRHADRVVDALAEAPRAEARRVLVSLVSLGVDRQHATRRRVALARLRPTDAAQSAAMDAACRALVDARLVFQAGSDGEETLEITHEALIRRWDRLAEWVQADREKLLATRDVEKLAQSHGKHGTLLHGNQLGHALEVMDQYPGALPAPVVTLIQRSERARVNQRRAKLITWGAVVAVLPVLTVYMWGQRNRQQALAARAQKASRLALATANRDDRAAMAVTALDGLDDAPGARPLLKQMAELPPSVRVLDQAGEAVFAPDSTHLAIGGAEHYWLTDLATVSTRRVDGRLLALGPGGWQALARVEGKSERVYLSGPDGPPTPTEIWLEIQGSRSQRNDVRAVFSPDGSRLAVGQFVGRPTRLWVIATDRPAAEPETVTVAANELTSLAFSADNQRLVATAWEIGAQTRLLALDPLRQVSALPGYDPVFTLDGQHLVLREGDPPRLDVHPLPATGPATPVPIGGDGRDLRSPDGRVAVTLSEDGLAVWRLPAGVRVAHYPGFDRARVLKRISADGRWLLSEEQREPPQRWLTRLSVPDGPPAHVPPLVEMRLPPSASGNEADLSPDGRWLVVDMGPHHELRRLQAAGAISLVAEHPVLAAAVDDAGRVVLLDAQGHVWRTALPDLEQWAHLGQLPTGGGASAPGAALTGGHALVWNRGHLRGWNPDGTLALDRSLDGLFGDGDRVVASGGSTLLVQQRPSFQFLPRAVDRLVPWTHQPDAPGRLTAGPAVELRQPVVVSADGQWVAGLRPNLLRHHVARCAVAHGTCRTLDHSYVPLAVSADGEIVALRPPQTKAYAGAPRPRGVRLWRVGRGALGPFLMPTRAVDSVALPTAGPSLVSIVDHPELNVLGTGHHRVIGGFNYGPGAWRPVSHAARWVLTLRRDQHDQPTPHALLLDLSDRDIERLRATSRHCLRPAVRVHALAESEDEACRAYAECEVAMGRPRPSGDGCAVPSTPRRVEPALTDDTRQLRAQAEQLRRDIEALEQRMRAQRAP